MAFTTENRSIQEIFQNRTIFRVPRYQRDYVWNAKNWEDLYNDIDFTVKNKQGWSHFLGTIVINYCSENDGVKEYELVDGQQRLTTLYLLLHSIYAHFSKSTKEEYRDRAEAMKDFLYSKSYSNTLKKKINNPKFDKTLNQICTYTDPNETFEITTKDTITEAFFYFEKNWQSQDEEYIANFLSELLNIKIVEIVCNEEEEIYNIFEVLNARGKQLKQIELLQNHILKYVSPREHLDDAKEKFNTLFSIIDEPDQEAFLFHFSKSYIKQKFSEKETYNMMKISIPIEKLSILLDDLLSYAEVYSEIIQNNSNHYLEYFSITRNKQVRPFLCSLLLKREMIGENNVQNTMKNLRNFLFIYNAVGLTANTTDKIVKDSAFELYHSTTKNEAINAINNFFNTMNVKYESSMSKEKFSNALKTGNKYYYSNHYRNHKSKGKLVKYVMVALNNEFSDNKLSNSQMSELTIEHLLGDTVYESVNQSLLRLTIVDSKTNSNRLKDKQLSQKLEILKDSSLYNNKLLLDYFIDNTMDWESYETDVINKLYNNVFKYTKQI